MEINIKQRQPATIARKVDENRENKRRQKRYKTRDNSYVSFFS